jgi:tetratricopeptide (TPR) repeat protein
MGASNNQQTTYLVLGLAGVATALALWYTLSSSTKGKQDTSKKSPNVDTPATASASSGITPQKSNVHSSAASTSASTAASSSTASGNEEDEKTLHRRIEEIDRKGKTLFKDKKYMEAAETFTEALDLIEAKKSNGAESGKSSSSLTRQIITLTNNRSAMYEKAALPDLALSDCDIVLNLDPAHSKARTRRLRILESQKRYKEAIVEVCALQLKYMNDNRDKIRLGLPPAGPQPVPQSKIEELVTLIQPEEMKKAQDALDAKSVDERALPSTYTILQLLKSFSGYNKWMGDAAKGGTVAKFTSQLEDLLDHVPRKSVEAYADNLAVKATLLSHRGRRHAFEKDFASAVKDFDEAYALVEDKEGANENDHEDMKKSIVNAMGSEEYARLLEWVGMCRHLRYDLKGSLECYERCCELEPENVSSIVCMLCSILICNSFNSSP